MNFEGNTLIKAVLDNINQIIATYIIIYIL